jgi:hypothetical protein
VQKLCSGCKNLVSVELFGRKTNAKDGLQSRCKSCQRLKVNEHYANNAEYYKEKAAKRDAIVSTRHRELLINFLRENPCVDCGNTDIEVLQFDHIDRKTKSGEVSNFLTGSTKRLMIEVNKCEIRCANCHIKKTRRQLGWWVAD